MAFTPDPNHKWLYKWFVGVSEWTDDSRNPSKGMLTGFQIRAVYPEHDELEARRGWAGTHERITRWPLHLFGDGDEQEIDIEDEPPIMDLQGLTFNIGTMVWYKGVHTMVLGVAKHIWTLYELPYGVVLDGHIEGVHNITVSASEVNRLDPTRAKLWKIDNHQDE